MARSPESLLISSFPAEIVHGCAMLFQLCSIEGSSSQVYWRYPLHLASLLRVGPHVHSFRKLHRIPLLLPLASFEHMQSIPATLILSPTILDGYIPDAFSIFFWWCCMLILLMFQRQSQPQPPNLDCKGLAEAVASGNQLSRSVQAMVCWMPGKAASSGINTSPKNLKNLKLIHSCYTCSIIIAVQPRLLNITKLLT